MIYSCARVHSMINLPAGFAAEVIIIDGAQYTRVTPEYLSYLLWQISLARKQRFDPAKIQESLRFVNDLSERSGHSPAPLQAGYVPPAIQDDPPFRSILRQQQEASGTDFWGIPGHILPADTAPQIEQPCGYQTHFRFWRSIHGHLVCGTCHPPVNSAIVREWKEDPARKEVALNEL